METLGIFHDTLCDYWGPGKLCLNTLSGLDKMGVPVIRNGYGKYNFCIGGKATSAFLNKNVKNAIIGPATFNFPSPDFLSQYSKFLVAGPWLRQRWINQGIPPESVSAWPGGIEDLYFEVDKNIKYDCLIHYKRTSIHSLNLVVEALKNLNLTYKIIGKNSSYYSSNHNYDSIQLLKLASECRFAYIVDGTETQGFANMEILSTNTPCIVYENNPNELSYSEIHKDEPLPTSVPYFSDDCGIITTSLSKETITNFIDRVPAYQPRKFMQNFTIQKSCEQLLGFFDYLV